MPRRLTPLVTGEYYHIFNRGVEKRPIFLDARNYRRFLDSLSYYQYARPPVRLAIFLKLARKEREKVILKLKELPAIIRLHCFVLMPNHFHLLVSQMSDGGISMFIKKVSDSYTRYFNTRHNRIGPLLQGQFKAVRIESDDQLLHLSRYIHLNPFTSLVISTLNELFNYPWSSLPQYLNNASGLCTIEKSCIILPQKRLTVPSSSTRLTTRGG